MTLEKETLNDYDFVLPKHLIAQHPVTFRDHCRLLIYHQQNQTIEHRRFYDLPEYLTPEDVLVFNNTRVLSSRCYFFRKTGGMVEVFYLKSLEDNQFEALIRGKANEQDQFFCEDIQLRLLKKLPLGHWIIEASQPPLLWLSRLGKPPLPPYIKRSKTEDNYLLQDQEQYQTVFATHTGAVASPTAGLHFTPRLLKQLQEKGVELFSVTLHVGAGTFQPIEVEDFRQYQIHREHYFIETPAKEGLIKAKKAGKRILTVGTTTVRTLESAGPELEKASGETQIFIYPPYSFQWCHSLLTNFHLPRSSLLLLVAAFVGRKKLLQLYQEAIDRNYRFFSYGDGMLIL